jgi:hypothetical protein
MSGAMSRRGRTSKRLDTFFHKGRDEGGREGPQRTGGSCGTRSSRKPSQACRTSTGSNASSHSQHPQPPNEPPAPTSAHERLGAGLARLGSVSLFG